MPVVILGLGSGPELILIPPLIIIIAALVGNRIFKPHRH